EIEAVLREEPIHAEHTRNDREQQHHREVGRDEEEDAFHGFGLRVDKEVSGEMGSELGDYKSARMGSGPRLYPEKQKGGRSRLSGIARPVRAGAALALGFGLLAFALGLSLAFRLGGLLALRLGGRRRGRGLRGCRRRGGRLRCDVESRARECGHHQDCDQLFHLEPRLELMSIAADMYSIKRGPGAGVDPVSQMICNCRPRATAPALSYNS